MAVLGWVPCASWCTYGMHCVHFRFQFETGLTGALLLIAISFISSLEPSFRCRLYLYFQWGRRRAKVFFLRDDSMVACHAKECGANMSSVQGLNTMIAIYWMSIGLDATPCSRRPSWTTAQLISLISWAWSGLIYLNRLVHVHHQAVHQSVLWEESVALELVFRAASLHDHVIIVCVYVVVRGPTLDLYKSA